MIRIYRKNEVESLAGDQNFDPGIVAWENASAHIVLIEDRRVTARCSVWWENTPRHPTGVCGTIGHFSAENPEVSDQLLEAACELLRQQGCAAVLAPMHGSTWRSYRYAIAGQNRAPFLMEPPFAEGRDRLLERNGFHVENLYYSYLERLQTCITVQHHARSAEHGIRMEMPDLSKLEESLRLVYRLSCICFQENDYFTDIAEQAFVEQYLAYRHLLIPEFILLAYKERECIGFVFCIPDYHENPQGKPSTIILKTIGVLPEYRRLGVGNALLDTVRQTAGHLGYTAAIGALVHETNKSKLLLRDHTILRQYALYGKAL